MTKKFKVIKRFSVPSTQSEIEKYAKKYPDVVLIAKRQTQGRGRNGRAFSSNLGGLYMSIRLKCYREASDSTLFVLYAGLAVSEALKNQGIETTLKFPNDVKYNGKKLCGIICSSKIEGKYVSSVTAGIGINLKNKLPDELCDIATNLSGKMIDKNKLVSDIAERFSTYVETDDKKGDLLTKYKSLSETIGYFVTVDSVPKITGKAIDIDEKGFLLVESCGIIKKVSYGDVTRS